MAAHTHVVRLAKPCGGVALVAASPTAWAFIDPWTTCRAPVRGHNLRLAHAASSHRENWLTHSFTLTPLISVGPNATELRQTTLPAIW